MEFHKLPCLARKAEYAVLEESGNKDTWLQFITFSLAGLTFLSCDLLLLLTYLINSFKCFAALCFESSPKFSDSMDFKTMCRMEIRRCVLHLALIALFAFEYICSLFSPKSPLLLCKVLGERHVKNCFCLMKSLWPIGLALKRIFSKGDLCIYNCPPGWLTRKSGLKLHLPTNCLKLSFQAQHPQNFCCNE